MGLVLVAVGVAGTRIGGVGTYGVAGDVVNQGLWSLWYAVNTLLALVLVGCFFAVPFRRLQVKTVAEVFLRRFGSRRCQVLTSLCVQTEYLIVNVLEPFVIGTILFAVTDLPFGVCVMSGAFLLIVYTSLGGLWGSPVTNLIHCSVIIVGLLLVALVGTSDLGGFAGVSEAIDGRLSGAELEPTVWWSFVGAGWGAVLAMFFSATVHTPAASVYVNFSAAAKKESQPHTGLLGRWPTGSGNAGSRRMDRGVDPGTLRAEQWAQELPDDHAVGDRHRALAGWYRPCRDSRGSDLVGWSDTAF